MNFVTLQFACFFLPAFLLLRFTRPRPALHVPALVFCNLCFYACAGLAGLSVLLACAIVTWFCGRAMGQGRRGRAALLCGLGFCLGLLVFFKCNEPVLALVCSLSDQFALAASLRPMLENGIVYIAGISFFVFQAVSYLVDVWRGQLRPVSLFHVLAWLSFFPLVMSGPITRAGAFLAQIGSPQEDKASVEEGFALIISGLFKKVVLSSYLAEHVVRQAFAAPESCSAPAVLIGIYAYAMQIYCDFSGYTDLAMGVARLIGYRLPDNFAAPYLACNIQDFWRRWHISLSSWFRDYLYVPLGGSRKGNVYFNLLLTMLLCGLWHGSGAGYLLWGVMHGLALCVHRVFSRILPARQGGGNVASPARILPAKFLSWLLTFHFVCLLWVFFKAENIDSAMTILARLLAFGQSGDGFALFALPAIFLCLVMQYSGPRCMAFCASIQARLPWPVQGLAVAGIVTLIFCLGPDGVLPFIYFGF